MTGDNGLAKQTLCQARAAKAGVSCVIIPLACYRLQTALNHNSKIQYEKVTPLQPKCLFTPCSHGSSLTRRFRGTSQRKYFLKIPISRPNRLIGERQPSGLLILGSLLMMTRAIFKDVICASQTPLHFVACNIVQEETKIRSTRLLHHQ